jgi:hypothetical protein
MSRFWETVGRKLEKTQSRNRLSGLEVMVTFFFGKLLVGFLVWVWGAVGICGDLPGLGDGFFPGNGIFTLGG